MAYPPRYHAKRFTIALVRHHAAPTPERERRAERDCDANQYADLSQWERGRVKSAEQAQAAVKASVILSRDAERAPTSVKKRLTWNEQRELEGIENAIHTAEAQAEKLQSAANDPALLSDHVKSRTMYEQLAAAQHEVERLYARWAELDAKK